MPQTNLPRGDEQGQVVRFAPTPLSADTRIGGFTFDGANDRMLRDYAEGGINSAFAWVSASVDTPRNALRTLTSTFPLTTDQMWCTATPERDARLPAGFTWVGVYYPMTLHADRWSLAREDVRVSYDCAHCAAIAARDTCAGREWTILAAAPGADLINWEPLEGELVGSEATWETCTDGAEDLMWERSCSKCGFGGHNASTCELPARYIDRMGIEIEGRWRNGMGARARLQERAGDAGHVYTSDGSIRMHDGYFGAEIPTKPASLRDSLRALLDFYPDHTGEDCGMHVHVSFQDTTLVSQLCTPEFFTYFREAWEAFIAEHRISPGSQMSRRLNDHNDYCGVNEAHEATDITEIGRIDRYRQINFAAWHEHKTVEFRLLPMFVNARVGVAAVMHLVKMLNTWFASAADRLPAFCDLTAGNLAEEERDLRVCTGLEPVILPLPADLEVDPAPFTMGGTAEVAIPALPDIPAGHQRLAVTADQLTQLQAILGRAA